MKFRDPWIDPRILRLRPEAVRAYLLAKGWQDLGPAAVPDLLMFDTPEPWGDRPNVLLPLRLDEPAYVQRLVELVGEVALSEDRYAGDVVSDMLRQPAEGAPAPGPDGPKEDESAPPMKPAERLDAASGGHPVR